MGRLRVVDAPGFSPLPHAVIRETRVSRDARLLYAVLQMYWWQGGECWASHATLAADMGCKERMLRYYLRELIAAGLITERLRGQGQAKAYAPAQAATDCQLERQEIAGSEPKRQGIAGQAATDCQFKRQGIADRRRSTEEESPKEEDTGVMGAASAPQAEPGKPKRRASRLDGDAAFTPQHLEAAVAIGLSSVAAEAEWAQFADYHRAKGSTMSDWLAAWRTWCRNSLKFGTRRNGQYGASARSSQPPTTAAHAQQPTRLPAKNVRTY